MDPTETDWQSMLLPRSGNIKVPNGADILFPGKIGPKIFAINDGEQIVKAGPSVRMCEAEAMRFVARETQIPVPEVSQAYIEDGNGYIVMSRLKGEPLGHVWAQLSREFRSAVITQLSGYVKELSSLQQDFYGALWYQPSQDIFFMHLPCKPEAVSYGPYRSRQQYNEGLVQALECSRPTASLSGSDEALVQRLLKDTDDTKVFTHGDLHLMNILVDKSTGRITGIVDWESAGFSVRGREYYEAKARARDDTWADALDEIFDETDRAHFDLFRELDRALTQYTFV